MRGAQLGRLERISKRGIIPACAGSTLFYDVHVSLLRDHPRMCGEHALIGTKTSASLGSSPHVRGAPCRPSLILSVVGIIPACAGSTQSGTARHLFHGSDHPRMCGEHSSEIESVDESQGSSPHVRGALLQLVRKVHICGIIPACAGSTLRK